MQTRCGRASVSRRFGEGEKWNEPSSGSAKPRSRATSASDFLADEAAVRQGSFVRQNSGTRSKTSGSGGLDEHAYCPAGRRFVEAEGTSTGEGRGHGWLPILN